MIDNINNTYFHLSNDKISYIIEILKNGQAGQLYFGPVLSHLQETDYAYLSCKQDKSAGTIKYYKDDHDFTLADRFLEYPVSMTTDTKEGAIDLSLGTTPCYLEWCFERATVTKGTHIIAHMPSCHGQVGVETLELLFTDALHQLTLHLYYTLFPKQSVIVKSARIDNHSDQTYSLERAMSATLSLNDDHYDYVHLSGAWAKERHIKTTPLTQGSFLVESLQGASSHQHNPFIALVSHDNQRAYGMNLMYSGNFVSRVDVNEWGMTRMMTGINPYHFEWQLSPQESFETPSALCSFSEEGLDGLSRVNAMFIERHIQRKAKHPIVLNSWEAFYFDYQDQDLLSLAKQGKELGIECFVVDDGWFGKRNTDRTSLGDWYANKKKFPQGLAPFAKAIHDLNLKLGMWIEPEMVNEESCFYQAHPDYVVRPPQGRYSYGRGQLVLDFANPEVVAAIYEQIKKMIEVTQTDYLKWDMNRNITEAYSPYLEKIGRPQGEFYHRYIQGVYALYEKIYQDFPNLFIEGCAGGGGRFDLGILAYSPMIWVSDDSDAIERLSIQWGTSMAYPISSLSNHVSIAPNHQTGRMTPLKTRYETALFGSLGYELDLNQCSQEEKNGIKQQIQDYKNIRDLYHKGTFYHLYKDDNECIWAYCSQDKENILVGYYRILAHPNGHMNETILLPFIDDQATYILNEERKINGSLLKRYGLKKPSSFNGVNKHDHQLIGDFQSYVYHLRKTS